LAAKAEIAVRDTFVFVEFSGIVVFMDDHLMKRYKVSFRAGEFRMLFAFSTNFTVVDLKLIRNRASSISQEAEQQVVHLGFSQDIDQIVIGERINDRVFE
jgi:hypothetical protein